MLKRFMKNIKLIGGSWLILIGIVLAAQGEPLRTDINPALLYYQAFLLAPNLSNADDDYLRTNIWRVPPLTERYGLILSNYDNETELLRQAAQQKPSCDWGIDLGRGVDTLLPQLARAKRAALALTWQTRWDLQDGDHTNACADLNATLVLGRNVAKDSPLISTLVGIAIEAEVWENALENFNHFSPQDFQRLADGFAAAPPRVTVADCVVVEKSLYPQLLIQLQNFEKENPDHELLIKGDHQNFRQFTNGAGGTLEGVSAASKFEPLYDQLHRIMTLSHDDFEKQMEKFQHEVAQSNYLFFELLEPWKWAREKEFRIEVDLAMVRAAIEYKLHGNSGLESVKDPGGNGPFTMQRFVYEGVDRGFKLTSAYRSEKGPEIFLFVEKAGPTFFTYGNKVGQPRQ
jgi:hypothetical protein